MNIGLKNWARTCFYRYKYHLKIGKASVVEGECEFTKAGKIFVGTNTFIRRWSCFREYGGYIRIGDNCTINSFCHLSGNGGIDVGNNVLIATQCVIISANHLFEDSHQLIRSQGETKGKIIIGNDVWLGAGVKVLAGVVIGEGSVVGAGAVVSNNIPPYSVAVGAPARVIRKRGNEGIGQFSSDQMTTIE